MSAILTIVARGLGALAVIVVVSGFTPLPNLLARALEPSPQRKHADAIVVLGADANRDGTPGVESVLRLIEGLLLYREGLAPLIVLSGGSDVAGRLVLGVRLGTPRAAFLPIDGARTTRDEARLVARRLRPNGTRSVLLVSGGQHLPRASRLFVREGLEVLPVPADVVAVTAGAPEHRLRLVRSVMEQLVARLYNTMGDHL
jgi:uncharacterized SAM-binding protein YcdF (DUF218 family)